MTTHHPTIAPTLAATMLVGWLMVQAGLAKRMLDWRGPALCDSLSARAAILRRSAAAIERSVTRWARG